MSDAPRLDHSMIKLKSGLMSASEKGKVTQNCVVLHPDVNTIKPNAPAYSFPKEGMTGDTSSYGERDTTPGAIYDIPGSVGDPDPHKGRTFPKSAKNNPLNDVRHLTDNATVLSVEQATIVDAVTKPTAPKYSMGNRSHYDGRLQNATHRNDDY